MAIMQSFVVRKKSIIYNFQKSAHQKGVLGRVKFIWSFLLFDVLEFCLSLELTLHLSKLIKFYNDKDRIFLGFLEHFPEYFHLYLRKPTAEVPLLMCRFSLF